MFQFIENVHDVLQFLFIAEWDADFSLALGRAGELHLSIEEFGELFSKHGEFLGYLCLGSDGFLAAFHVFTAFQSLYHLFHLSHGVTVLLDFLEELDLKRRTVEC